MHGRRSVEHAAQRAVEQLAEPVDRGFDAAGEIDRVGARELCHLVGRARHHRRDVGERDVAAAAACEMGDGPAEHGVLDRCEVAMQHRSEQRADHRGLPACELVGSVDESRGAGIERVDARGAAGMQLDDVEAERLGERQVLALGIGDRDPAAEHADRAVDEHLRGRALADADLAGEQHVRVRERAGGVGLERVEREAAAAREHVGAEVDAARSEARLGEERVRGAEMRGRRAMSRRVQPAVRREGG